MKLRLAVLLLLGCGRGALQGPPAVEDAIAEPPEPPACVVVNDFNTSRWACETVSALEVVSLKVINGDGTSPWSSGPPYVRALMRNTTGQFLNYPGVQIGASEAALLPRFARDSLYGMSGCQQVELGMGFGGTVQSGTEVTFTATPAYINDDVCPLSSAPVSVTVTAP